MVMANPPFPLLTLRAAGAEGHLGGLLQSIPSPNCTRISSPSTRLSPRHGNDHSLSSPCRASFPRPSTGCQTEPRKQKSSWSNSAIWCSKSRYCVSWPRNSPFPPGCAVLTPSVPSPQLGLVGALPKGSTPDFFILSACSPAKNCSSQSCPCHGASSRDPALVLSAIGRSKDVAGWIKPVPHLPPPHLP